MTHNNGDIPLTAVIDLSLSSYSGLITTQCQKDGGGMHDDRKCGSSIIHR